MLAEHGLQNSTCPIVLVDPRRGMRPWECRRILVPHDGTPSTTHAIVRAAELARVARAHLSVLHVASEGTVPPTEPGSLGPPRYLDQPQHEWPSWAAEFLDRIAGLLPLESLQLQLSLARGEPGAEIVRHAEAAMTDLILLAWRGETDSRHASIVRAVISHAPCPTMIVRA
jgi:nucleotide-binding universal stress UspA family protein